MNINSMPANTPHAFNLLPEKIYGFKGKSCHGSRDKMEKILIRLVCINIDESEQLSLPCT
jgi:hypothetical protein